MSRNILRWPLSKALLLLLFTLPFSTLRAQVRFTAATGLYTNTLSLGLSTYPLKLPLPGRQRPLTYQLRALMAPWPSNDRKYLLGPSLILHNNKTANYRLYTPLNLTIGTTPFNIDKGLLAGIGIEQDFSNVTASCEYNIIADVAPSPSSSLPFIEQTFTGLVVGFLWEI